MADVSADSHVWSPFATSPTRPAMLGADVQELGMAGLKLDDRLLRPPAGLDHVRDDRERDEDQRSEGSTPTAPTVPAAAAFDLDQPRARMCWI